MRVLHFILIFSVLAASVKANEFGSSPTNWCAVTMAKILGRMSEISAENVSPKATVRVGLKVNGKYGFPRYILNKVGSVWWSVFEQFDNAPEGDPRSFLFLFGLKTARKFGFDTLNEKKMIAPSAEEFTTAIDAFNQLPYTKKILLRFYTPEKAGVINDLAFIARFVFQSELPIAPVSEASLFLHDISYHAAAIGIPDVYIKHAQKQNLLLIHFIKSLRENPSLKDQAWIQDFTNKILADYANNIDAGTANIMTAFLKNSVVSRTQQSSMLKKDLTEWTNKLTIDGNSPIESLLLWSQEFFRIHGHEVASQDQKQFIDMLTKFTNTHLPNTDFSESLPADLLEGQTIAKLIHEKISGIENF